MAASGGPICFSSLWRLHHHVDDGQIRWAVLLFRMIFRYQWPEIFLGHWVITSVLICVRLFWVIQNNLDFSLQRSLESSPCLKCTIHIHPRWLHIVRRVKTVLLITVPCSLNHVHCRLNLFIDLNLQWGFGWDVSRTRGIHAPTRR